QFLLFLLLLLTVSAQSQTTDRWTDDNFKGIKLRSIGPAFMSGRIADIAIHPQRENTWYVAVASGGVWKTVNAGVTFEPIFDKEGAFATGCVTVDPRNPHVVWVGTGENNGGRHISFGDGVYRSDNGGKSWKNMGLPKSEHISKIIVHPEDSDVVWVASQGPLWTKGGERGVYKTTNGGRTWKRVLGSREWTGATDLVIDPRNPDQLYAATWDRQRTVAAFMSGGPGSGLHRSDDGGETWEELKTGLPKSNMGKIGLTISPQQPDVLYAAIELDRRKGGVYKSTDRGATWKKMSDAVSGATGPHYYQELVASPHQFDRIYLLDVRVQVSEDGGKTFRRLTEKHKHSDNHSLTFRKEDPNYLLMGTDGGVYESFDLGANWRFMENLPLTQFYKVAVDDAEPFYNIYGGTQDNSTEGGPSRTDNIHGIQNSDWSVVLDWDGHQPATEPGNPDIMYGQRQEGTLARIDLTTGETMDIQPQPAEGEDYERFNWDAPILVSPHSPQRIFFASQRLWVSDNRGDDWRTLSGDLTRDQNRLELPILGKKQSWDNPWDVSAMSNYNTITSIAQSPLDEKLIYIGTDDGMIQVTEDYGKTWRKVEISTLKGAPKLPYINVIKADLHDANTVYAAMDNHKYGDYQPYVLKSTDRGKTWTQVQNNLPKRTLVWRLVQDHVNKNLWFAGTEFGIYFSPNAGQKWIKLQGGVPNISFRDLAIQRRENDLVGASFGRSFYVLDDISVLREVDGNVLNKDAHLFSTRKAWWYVPRGVLGFEGKKGDQGADHYVADNPDFGAVLTYYLKDDLQSKKEMRTASEKKQTAGVTYTDYATLEQERREEKPQVWLTIKDAQNNVVRRVPASAKKGFHRVAWDLRYPAPDAISMIQPPPPMWGGPPQGMMAAPGTYSATLVQMQDGKIKALAEPIQFEVVPLREGALKGATPAEVATFWRQYEDAVRSHSAIQMALKNALTKTKRMQKVLLHSPTAAGDFDTRLHQIRTDLFHLDEQLNGNRAQQEIGEKVNPTVGGRLFSLQIGIDRSTYGPTANHQAAMGMIEKALGEAKSGLTAAQGRLSALAKELVENGAPWME
ncbi:MAG: WD40/YVTN/BNR-like repeat-containing protein, partial [Saprospiraceae bacterium]